MECISRLPKETELFELGASKFCPTGSLPHVDNRRSWKILKLETKEFLNCSQNAIFVMKSTPAVVRNTLCHPVISFSGANPHTITGTTSIVIVIPVS